MKSLYKGEVIQILDVHSADAPKAIEVTCGLPPRTVVISNPHPLEFLPARDSTYYQILVETYIRTGSIVVCDDDTVNIVSANGLDAWDNLLGVADTVDVIWSYLEKLNGPR